METDADPNDQQAEDGIAGLRARADAAGTLEAENSQLQRELAFVRAGIDTSTDIGATLMRGYDGELTTEALGPLAEQMAAISTSPSTQQSEQLTQPAPQADPPSPLDAMNAVAGGLAPGITPPRDLVEEGWSEYQNRVKSGARPEDAAAELLNRVIDGAVREMRGEPGFNGFIYEQQAYHEKLNGG